MKRGLLTTIVEESVSFILFLFFAFVFAAVYSILFVVPFVADEGLKAYTSASILDNHQHHNEDDDPLCDDMSPMSIALDDDTLCF